MSNRFASLKTLSLNGAISNTNSFWFIKKFNNSLYNQDDRHLYLLQRIENKTKVSIFTLIMYQTFFMKKLSKFSILLVLLFSIFQSCEDFDDVSTPSDIKVNDFTYIVFAR